MENEHFKKFRSRVLSLHRDLINTSVSEWVEKNTYLGKRKFTIGEDYLFQREILDDLHPNLCVIKLSQIGMTEVQIRKAFAFLHKYSGTRAIFSLPDLQLQKQVSATRIKPIIQNSPILEKSEGDTRTSTIYQFSGSFLHVVHASESAATSTPADMLMIDELDLSDQEIVSLFSSRLQNSNFKINQQFSTPTFKGFGIDALYNLSDQREFTARCSHCNHLMVPDYTWDFVEIPGYKAEKENLVTDLDDKNVLDIQLENSQVVCEKCRKPLDLTKNRKWVAAFPNRILSRGYKITPFSTNRLTIPYIAMTLNSYKRKDKLRRGVNTVLGKAYEDSSARLTEQEIELIYKSGKVPVVGEDVPVYIGIDVGITCHIVLGVMGERGICPIRFLTCGSNILLETVKVLCETYNIVAGGIDRYPYTPKANELRDQTEAVIVPMSYQGEKTFTVVKSEDKELDYYHINRTFMADIVTDNVRNKAVTYEGYKDQGDLIKAHLRDMYRETEDDGRAVWKKLTGRDHYFHALIYLTAAAYIKNAEKEVDSGHHITDTVVKDIKFFEDKNRWQYSIR